MCQRHRNVKDERTKGKEIIRKNDDRTKIQMQEKNLTNFY